jgi:hypothetical protein
MEIDMTWRRGPLSDEEKQRRQANHLCLYCVGSGHIAIHCPHWPRRQVNLISYENKNDFDILESPISDSSNLTLSNKFEVLNQLEEESNE